MTLIVNNNRPNNTDLVEVIDGEAVTSSLAIAQGTSNPHASVLKLVRNNQEDFEEFGRVGFEIRPFDTAGGTQKRTVAYLNEHQATLLMTYLRNTTVVKDFKKKLVRAFFELRDNASAEQQAQTNQSFGHPEDEDVLIARALIASNKKTLALEAKLEEVSPKVEFFDEYIDTGSLHSLHDAARAIGWRPNIFCQELREQGILQKGRTLPSNQPDQSVHNVAYQTYVNQGYFVNKTRRGTLFDGSPYHTVTSWMTPKGVAWIEKRLGQDDKKPRSARKPKEPTPNPINFNYVPSRFL